MTFTDERQRVRLRMLEDARTELRLLCSEIDCYGDHFSASQKKAIAKVIGSLRALILVLE